MSDDIFGNSRYGGFKRTEYVKLKDGDNIYRILPAMGYLAKDGKWSEYLEVHYGYKTTKGKLRLFLSTLKKNRKNKNLIEVPDAALERIQILKAKLDEAKATGNTAVVNALNPLVGPNKALYNLDKNHHVLALDQQNNIVVLKLRYKAKLAVDNLRAQLKEKGIDPIAAENGRWINIRRAGMGLDTTFAATVVTETLDVKDVGQVQRDVVHSIDKALAGRLLARNPNFDPNDKESEEFIYKEAVRLDSLYTRLSSDDVQRIVSSSDLQTGVSPVIDELFPDYNSDESAETEEKAAAPAQTTAPAPQASAPAPTPAPAPVAAAPAPVATPPPLAMTPPPTPAPAAASAPTQPTQPMSKPISQMNNDEFLASIGVK